MVTTGIKRFDDLPSRIGPEDIDYMRFRYKQHLNNMFIGNKFLKMLNRFIFGLTGREFGRLYRRLEYIVGEL